VNQHFSDDKNQAAEAFKYYPAIAEQWKGAFLELRHSNIIKHPRVLQTLFYLLGYKREEICERGTNALDFKLAREQIGEVLF